VEHDTDLLVVLQAKLLSAVSCYWQRNEYLHYQLHIGEVVKQKMK